MTILLAFLDTKTLFFLLSLSTGTILNQKTTKFEKTDQNTFLKTVPTIKENGSEISVMDEEFKNGIQVKFMRASGKMIKLKDMDE
jgi:hypothetical protein